VKLLAVALVCLTVQTQAVTVSEGDGLMGVDAAVDDQLSALFDDEHFSASQASTDSDKGRSLEAGSPAPIDEDGDLGEAVAVASGPRHISYQFKDAANSSPNLGETSSTASTAETVSAVPVDKTRRMIELGTLLESLGKGHLSHRTAAVTSLQEALQTKLLMDELKPRYGSFAQSQPHHVGDVAELGEESKAPPSLPSFKRLLNAKKNNLVGITKYLLERKKTGQPLSSEEDDELQKFYYSRAATILKKIVLLKRGDEPAHEAHFSEEHETVESVAADRAASEVQRARDHAEAVVERLHFDAKVANANAEYNKKMLVEMERRMEAATQERKQAEAQQLKAAKSKLIYDEQVAEEKDKYNEALSSELLQRKKVAEIRVEKASQQKHLADIAAKQATLAADEADKEAKEAELEAEAATKHAEELEQKQLARDRAQGQTDKQVKKQPSAIPLSVIPHIKLNSLLRYLSSALDRHVAFSPAEQELMQSFFLKHGSALLSQLAQVDPDATWHSKGVVAEQQYEMDRGTPDQLSKEWGSNNLRDDTVVSDFVGDALWAKRSKNRLARPDGGQDMIGLFGSNHKVPLKFAQDSSAPMSHEPDLGEAELDDDIEGMGRAYPNAMSTMLGVGEAE